MRNKHTGPLPYRSWRCCQQVEGSEYLLGRFFRRALVLSIRRIQRPIGHLRGDDLPSDHPGRIYGRDMFLTTRYPDEETYKESHWT